MAKQLDQQSKPTHDEIAQRAFELFEKSGRLPGHDVENWLNAEKQLVAARRPAAEAKKQASSANSNGAATSPRARATAGRHGETSDRMVQHALAGSRRG